MVFDKPAFKQVASRLMERDWIIAEIRRTAQLNGDKPLGIQRFANETGIRRSDWWGIYWASWGEAVAEAGLEPNSLATGLEEEQLIELFMSIIRECGAWPSEGKLRLICRQREDLPNGKTFRNRLGNNATLAKRVIAHCNESEEPNVRDVIAICEPVAKTEEVVGKCDDLEEAACGFVYLMKSGKYHKIGKSNSVGRREYELGTKLPEMLTTVYTIQTDDPAGIERYWHDRFADKRQEGEWLSLSAADVAAFKR